MFMEPAPVGGNPLHDQVGLCRFAPVHPAWVAFGVEMLGEHEDHTLAVEFDVTHTRQSLTALSGHVQTPTLLKPREHLQS